jgi:nickel superoxide dismutase
MRRICLSGNVLAVVLLAVLSVNTMFAHCEVPCGIYGDVMRFDMIAEHITTIERSMNMIAELSAEPDKNYNQLIRWITNKEHHANEIQDIVHQYFMTQRVKPVDKENSGAYNKYIKQLTVLHEMLVHAMKAKQTTDITHIEKLKSLLEEFRQVYFGD